MLLRFPSLAGLGTTLTGSLRGKLDAIRGAILRGEDDHRGTRSMLELLLHEMQHPKQAIYESAADVVCGAGALTVVSPFVDVRQYRFLGWYLANVGQQVTTTLYCNWSENPAGAAPYGVSWGVAGALAAGITWYSQDDSMTQANWLPTRTAQFCGSYVQFAVTSANGTSIRVKLVGMR